MTDEHSPVNDFEPAYEGLLEISTDPLYFAANGTIKIVNDSFVDLTGYSRRELVGMSVEKLVHDADFPEWRHHFELHAGQDDTGENRLVGRIISKNGAEIPVECHFSTVGQPRTDHHQIACRVRDLREEKQQEKKLDVLNRALRHDIRNQMNLVVAKAAQLQGVDDRGYQTAAEKIEEIGRHVINLSEKARLAQEHIGIPSDEECRVELVEVTEHTIAKFEIEHPDVSVKTELPAGLPARAPPSFEVALYELLENAVIHHPTNSGPVEVEITSDDHIVEIRIRDECEPIPEQIQRTINRGSEDPLEHNDGLGLWIVKWAVQTVGGELSFERRGDDNGNVVTITFETIPALAELSDTD